MSGGHLTVADLARPHALAGGLRTGASTSERRMIVSALTARVLSHASRPLSTPFWTFKRGTKKSFLHFSNGIALLCCLCLLAQTLLF